MPAPRMLMILSENWTLTDGRDLTELVQWARIAEDAGFDSVMISEHIVLGPDASDKGVMANPRAYALPGNQDPLTPWPNSLMLLSAMASVTNRIRLVASAVLAPLRHPLLLARELGTLDLISGGRLVVQPSVSWSRDEYVAMGVPFTERGRILDEQLAVMDLVFRESPASHHGRYFEFDDIYLEPKAHRPGGPRMWFGGQTAHGAVVQRLVRYGHGFHPLGVPTADDMRVIDRGDDGRRPQRVRPGIDRRGAGGVPRRPLLRRHRKGHGHHSGAAAEGIHHNLREAVDVHRRRRRPPGVLRRRDAPG